MEDILASIRRIITDDDAGKGQGDKPAAAAQTEDASLEGEADNQIIDDIARVLSSGSDEPADEDEEIMDLTGELGGLELVEEEPQDVLETPEPVDAAPEFVESSDVSDEVVALDAAQPDVLQPDVPQADDAGLDVLEPEIIEKLPGRPVHRRTARHITVPHDVHPFTFKQRLHDIGADRHAPHALDLAACNRLPVGNQRQRLQQRA
jgi:cell pole-organizing protein PopZ